MDYPQLHLRSGPLTDDRKLRYNSSTSCVATHADGSDVHPRWFRYDLCRVDISACYWFTLTQGAVVVFFSTSPPRRVRSSQKFGVAWRIVVNSLTLYIVSSSHSTDALIIIYIHISWAVISDFIHSCHTGGAHHDSILLGQKDKERDMSLAELTL